MPRGGTEFKLARTRLRPSGALVCTSFLRRARLGPACRGSGLRSLRALGAPTEPQHDADGESSLAPRRLRVDRRYLN